MDVLPCCTRLLLPSCQRRPYASGTVAGVSLRSQLFGLSPIPGPRSFNSQSSFLRSLFSPSFGSFMQHYLFDSSPNWLFPFFPLSFALFFVGSAPAFFFYNFEKQVAFFLGRRCALDRLFMFAHFPRWRTPMNFQFLNPPVFAPVEFRTESPPFLHCVLLSADLVTRARFVFSPTPAASSSRFKASC